MEGNQPIQEFSEIGDARSGGRRVERAIFETDRHCIVGDVTLPPAGYQSRFSDSLNRSENEFIPLTNVELTPHDGGETVSRGFVILNKRHVRLSYPLND